MESEKSISGSLQSLTATLGQSHLAAVPAFQGFPPFDVQEIARRLDLYARAADAAQRGDPPSTAEPPDGFETAIARAIESRVREAALAYDMQLAKHDAAICRTLLTDDECLAIEGACTGRLEALQARVRAVQVRLLEFRHFHVESAEAEFQLFRARNGLEKPPHLPSRGERLVRGLVLGMLAMAVALVSGRLLEAGWSGFAGALPSILFSLLNVGPAVWYARRGLPPLLGRGFRSKLLGTISAAAFLGWILALNGLGAHCREVLLANKDGAALAELWRHVSLAPLTLASGSWMLAILGTGSGTVALFVAAGMGELYPGYGAAGRRRAAALAAFKIEDSTCSKQLTVIQRAAIDDLRALREAMRSRESESSTAAAAREHFHGEFVAHLDRMAAAHTQLCRCYREINVAVRGADVPRYFGLDVERPACLADPGLPHRPKTRDTWHEANERLQQYERLIASLFAQAPLSQAVPPVPLSPPSAAPAVVAAT